MKPSQKLTHRIKQEGTKPIPRSFFRIKKILTWVIFGLAVLLGALAFSVILFTIQQTDFELIAHISHSRLEMLLGLLPFLWITMLILFLILGMYSIQYAPRGYKFTLSKMVGFSAGLSILLGTLFFIGGGARQLEDAFALRLGLYESIQEKKVRLWSMPEEGYLSGEILEVSPVTIKLKDFNGKFWSVRYEEAFVRPAVLLEEGEKIKLLGTPEEHATFSATEIRPWGGRPR